MQWLNQGKADCRLIVPIFVSGFAVLVAQALETDNNAWQLFDNLLSIPLTKCNLHMVSPLSCLCYETE